MSNDYKIVPLTQRTPEEKIYNLREFLTANLGVAKIDEDWSKVAMFQECLDTVDRLVELSHDRHDRF